MAQQKKRYNRIKLVLIEKEKTNIWLAQKMGVTPAAVSRWCTNDAQPTIESLFKIARLLEVEIIELLNTKQT
jgi:putative transcriptional regulator